MLLPGRSRRRRALGCLSWCAGLLALCAAVPLSASFYFDRTEAAPSIPRYPRTEGLASYPSRTEMALTGEAFGGFQTPDSYRTILDYYSVALPAAGFVRGWYRGRDDRCYTLLIIENDPRLAGVPPGHTSVAFKLRPAFTSEIGKGAPADCRDD